MRFDWYQATVLANPHDVIEALSCSLEAPVVTSRGRLNYKRGVRLDDGLGTVEVLWDGNGPNPHVVASGSSAPSVATVLRSAWSDSHKVTRCDVCEDVDRSGLWDEWLPLLLSVADEHSIKTPVAGDWHRGVDGRTQYVGAKTSDLQVRMYEKGKQLIGQGQEASPDYLRLELEYRPKSDPQRLRAAIYEPEHYWGLSAWTLGVAKRLLTLDAPRIKRTQRRVMTLDRQINALLSQYWGPLWTFVRDVHGGDWASAGYDLEARANVTAPALRRLRKG